MQKKTTTLTWRYNNAVADWAHMEIPSDFE